MLINRRYTFIYLIAKFECCTVYVENIFMFNATHNDLLLCAVNIKRAHLLAGLISLRLAAVKNLHNGTGS